MRAASSVKPSRARRCGGTSTDLPLSSRLLKYFVSSRILSSPLFWKLIGEWRLESAILAGIGDGEALWHEDRRQPGGSIEVFAVCFVGLNMSVVVLCN